MPLWILVGSANVPTLAIQTLRRPTAPLAVRSASLVSLQPRPAPPAERMLSLVEAPASALLGTMEFPHAARPVLGTVCIAREMYVSNATQAISTCKECVRCTVLEASLRISTSLCACRFPTPS